MRQLYKNEKLGLIAARQQQAMRGQHTIGGSFSLLDNKYRPTLCAIINR
jgi:hypothetical protein